MVLVSQKPGEYVAFQPFLRFYHSCAQFLWVFKFFFDFL